MYCAGHSPCLAYVLLLNLLVQNGAQNNILATLSLAVYINTVLGTFHYIVKGAKET